MTIDDPTPTQHPAGMSPARSVPALRAGYNSEVPDISKWRQYDRDHQPPSTLLVWQRRTANHAKRWSLRWRLWADAIAHKHW